MSNSIKDKNLTPDETAKLKQAINATVVALTHIEDTRLSMNENIAEVAEELEIKKSEIMEAARTLHKNNFAEKEAKVEANRSILEALGYDLDD